MIYPGKLVHADDQVTLIADRWLVLCQGRLVDLAVWQTIIPVGGAIQSRSDREWPVLARVSGRWVSGWPAWPCLPLPCTGDGCGPGGSTLISPRISGSSISMMRLWTRPWRGVAARLDSGGMTILARGDVAQVGASRVSAHRVLRMLIRSSRRSLGCLYVSVTFYCTYAIGTTDGNAATAIVNVHSNRNYSIGVSIPGSPNRWRSTSPASAERTRSCASSASAASLRQARRRARIPEHLPGRTLNRPLRHHPRQ